MITFLTKSDASEGFDQIVDFLNAHNIQYVLMVNPPIYVSCIKQFWALVSVKKTNDVVKLQALIDRKKVVITEDTIRQDLRLDDADGVDCLPNEEIFAELAHMGYEKPPPKLTFYKARIGNGFSGVETPLFDTMLVQPQVHDAAKVDAEDKDDNEVAHLEQDKVAQALEIVKLKQRVKKLKKKRRSKSSGLKRLRKEGGIAELDADEDVTLVDVDTVVEMDANTQGRMEEDVTAVKEINDAEPEPIVFDDEEMAKRLQDEEIEQVAARERQEKEDLERAKVLQQQYDQKQEKIDWNSDRDEEPTKKRAAKETMLQESFKKLRAEVEVSGSHSTQEETPTNDPKEMSEEDVKNMLQIVLVAEFKVKALQVKYPLIDWEIYSEGSRTYWRIIRVDGITQAF
nr:hypothetical protein [Tanacetum cinerariifolium]